MKNVFYRFQVFVLLVAITTRVAAVEFDLRGQFSTQLARRYSDDEWLVSAGMQYIPQLRLSQTISSANIFDLELSYHSFVHTDQKVSWDNLKLYRFNVRYATEQSEIQIGLQKINFGPAQLLRALMWFDRLDPRDPMKITEGVYGLRYRYNFLNNANIWLWGLYGNDEPKGYEITPTAAKKPEFGWRIQTPVPMGEMAVTFHSRTANGIEKDFRENRFALDGRWDVFVGAWFEAVVQHQDIASPYNYTKMLTLGLDYTFGIGNGLYTLFEHKVNCYDLAENTLDNNSNELSGFFLPTNNNVQMSAVMLNYPLTFFDNLMLIEFYSWETKDFYQYLGWQRTYDSLIVNVSAFNYPESPLMGANSFGAGYGVQLMFIYNH